MMNQAKMAQKSQQVANILRNYSFNERYEWVSQRKAKGNRLFGKDKYDEAIDAYLEALLGCGQDSDPENTKKLVTNLKLPSMNNIIVCLTEKGEYNKAVSIATKVIYIYIYI